MVTHAPAGYQCPFCLVVQGIEQEKVLTRQTDIVVRTEDVTAFMCSYHFANNPGHTLIIPNAHFENLYALPVALLNQIHAQAQVIAQAMKSAFQCDGITVWQSNEPAGTQTVWHYHVHVIPRFKDDAYFHNLASLESTYVVMDWERRAELAEQLRTRLRDQQDGGSLRHA